MWTIIAQHTGRDADPRGADLAAKAQEIEDAIYDLKVVNPHRKPDVDDRTPEDLMDIIEAKGREIAETLAALQGAGGLQ